MDSSTNNVDMGASSADQHQQSPRLCATGCGFFGTAKNGGFCSKCCNSFLLREPVAEVEPPIPRDLNMPLPLITSPPPPHDNSKTSDLSSSTSSGEAPAPPQTKRRCNSCEKKLGVSGFSCRYCGGSFCSCHRLPEAHACDFDFKKAGKVAIKAGLEILRALCEHKNDPPDI